MKLLDVVKEFLNFLRNHARWWVIPTMVLILAITILVWLSSGPSVAPFLYHR